MANDRKVTAILDLDASGVKKGAQEAKQAIQGIEDNLSNMKTGFKSLEKTGAVLTAGLTLPLVGFAKTSIDTAKSFEYSMSEVSAISGATGSDLEALRKQAEELGSTTFYSAQEASQGMKYYAMAGYDVKQIMDAMPSSIDLAVASNTDLATVCDIVSDAMTGLCMSTEETTHFTDILAKTATSTNTTVQGLGESFKYVAPVAGQLGINAEDLAVALGTMANAGIKGSMSGRQLRQGLTRLTGGVDSVKKVMDKYNISLQLNKDGSVNLMDTVIHLKDKLKDLSSVEKAQVLSELFGAESMAGWSALLDNSEQATESMKKLTEEIYNCDGSAKDMAKTMGDNFEGKMKSFQSALEGVKIAVGNILIPALTVVVKKITEACNWFNNLSDGSKKLIVAFGGFLAVLGPMMLILPKIITLCGALKAGFIALKAGIGLTVGATTALTAGIGIVVTALVGLMTYIGGSSDMLTALQDNFGTFGVVVGGICESLHGWFMLVFGNAGKLLGTLGKMLMALMKGDFKEAGNIWKEGWADIKANTAKAGADIALETTKSIKKIKEMSATELASLESTFDTTMSTLKTVTVDNIDEATSVFVEQLKGMDNETISLLSGTSDSMAMLFNNITANMTDTQATNVFKANLEAMVRSGQLSLETLEADSAEFSKIIANNISTGGAQVQQAGETVWDNFKNVSKRGIESVASSTVADIQKMNADTFNELKNAGDNWGQLFDGISLDAGMSTAEMEQKVVENFRNMNMNGTQLIDALKNDISTKFSEASNQASSNMSQVENAVSTSTSNAKASAEANMSGVKTAVESGTSNAKSNAETNMTGVKTAIEKNTNVSGAVSNNMNNVNSAIAKGTSNATKTAEQNTKGMKDAVDKNTKNLSKSADTNFKAIDKSAKSSFTSATNSVKKDATSMYNGAKTSFTKLASEASTAMKNLKSNVTSYTSSMKNSAISDWNAIRNAYSKTITGKIEITKTTTEKTSKVTTTSASKSSYIPALLSTLSLSDADVMARQEALYSFSNMDYGDKMAVDNSTKSNRDEEKTTTTRESNNNITYNYTYNSPIKSSISELRRQDRVQAQRLALSFK